MRCAYSRFFVLLRMCFLWILVWVQTYPLAWGQGGSDVQPGVWVVPSVFDSSNPFPLSISKDSATQIAQDVTNLKNKNVAVDKGKVLLSHMHSLGVYPTATKSALPPFGQWMLSGDFYQGPKRLWMEKMHRAYQKGMSGVATWLAHIRESGALAHFGWFENNERFVASVLLPPHIRQALTDHMHALVTLHDMLETALLLPPEYIDPDVVLDHLNAAHIGPRLGNAEPLQKESVSRFCATSYVYRYVRNQEAFGNDIPDVSDFARTFYTLEAAGKIGSVSLDQRKNAYRLDYQRTAKVALPTSVMDEISAVAISWMVVPQFSLSSTHELRYAETLTSFYIPLWQKEGKWHVHPTFYDYVQAVARHMVYDTKLKTTVTAADMEKMIEIHQQILWRSLGLPSASDVGRIADDPLEYFRFKDQYLLFRQRYQDRDIVFTGKVGNAYGMVLDGAEDQGLEGIVPHTLCQSIWRRNFVTEVLLTHKDPRFSVVSAEDLAPKIWEWFDFWTTGESTHRMVSAFSMPQKTLRPWSMVDHFHLQGKWFPHLGLEFAHTESAYDVTPMTVTDGFFPKFGVPFGDVSAFLTAISDRAHFQAMLQSNDSPIQSSPAPSVTAHMPYLQRSRVLFTPYEILRMLSAYSEDLLIPLAILSRYVSPHAWTQHSNSQQWERLKRFSIRSGMVPRTLLYLLQAHGKKGWMDVLSEQGELLSDESGLKEDSLSPHVQPTRDGIIISLAEAFFQPHRPSFVIPDWSKTDRLRSAMRSIERRLHGKTLRCEQLPSSHFVKLQQQIGGDVTPTQVQQLVCAVPTLFSAVSDFAVQMAKHHIQFESLKTFWKHHMPIRVHDSALLPSLHHVLRLPSVMPRLVSDAQKDTHLLTSAAPSYSLSQAITDYETLMRLWVSYKSHLDWAELTPKTLAMLMHNNAPNWSYVATAHTTQIENRTHTFALDEKHFDSSCTPMYGELNPYLDAKAGMELKMLCLWRRVSAVHRMLHDGFSDALELSGSNHSVAIKGPFAATIENIFWQDFRETSQTPAEYVHRMSQRLRSWDPIVVSDKNVLTPATWNFGLKTVSNASDPIARPIFLGFDDTATQTANAVLGQWIEGVLAGVFLQENVTLLQGWGIWKRLLAIFSDPTDWVAFFGQDFILGEPKGESFVLLQDRVRETYGGMITMATGANLGRTDSHYRHLQTELALFYRELQLEGLVRNAVAVKIAKDDASALTPISVALPENRNMAHTITTVSAVGELDLFSQWTGMKLAYNRETLVGKTFGSVIDFLGFGDGSGNVGTTFETEPGEAGFWNSAAGDLEQTLCHHATQHGGRLLPWLSLESTRSFREAFDPWHEDGSWLGWRLSFWNHSHPEAAVSEASFASLYCDIQVAKKNRTGEFQPLTQSELGKISEANAFLAQVAEEWQTSKFERDRAHSELAADWMEAVVMRIFLDKIKTHILLPYQEALQILAAFFQKAQKILTEETALSDLSVAQTIFRLLHAEFVDSEKGQKLLRHYYLRRLLVGMLTQLFPTQDLRHVTRKELLTRLSILYGRGASGSDVKVTSSADWDGVQKKANTESILAHVAHVVAETESFVTQVGQSLMMRYPMLEESVLTRTDGSAISLTSVSPKRYHQLFALPIFDVYRTVLSEVPVERAVKNANGALHAVITGTHASYYGRHPDLMDSILRSWTLEYAFSPTHVWTQRLSHTGQANPLVDAFTMLGAQSNQSIWYIAEHAIDDEGEAIEDQPLRFAWQQESSPPLFVPKTEGERITSVYTHASRLFPWMFPAKDSKLPAFQNPLQRYFGGLEPGATRYFSMYLSTAAGLQWFPSSGRTAWNSHFRTLLDTQEGHIAVALERTLRDISVAELPEVSNSGVLADVDASLIGLFSNPAMVQMMEERFSDRFLELQSAYMPARITAYTRGEHATQHLMEDIGKIFGAVTFATLMLAGASKLVGLVGKGLQLTKLGAIQNRLFLSMAFLVRHGAVLALGTLASYSVFSWLGMSPNIVSIFLLHALLLVPVSWWARGGLAGQQLRRSTAWRLARLIGYDILAGVVLMDVMGLALGWESANHLSSSYHYYQGLWYAHMELSPVYRTLWNESPPLLLSDTSHVAYLMQAYQMQMAVNVFANLLVFMVDGWWLRSALRPSRFDITRDTPETLVGWLEQTLARLGHPTLEGQDPFLLLRSQDPLVYMRLLIATAAKEDELVLALRSGSLSSRGEGVWTRLLEDVQKLRVQFWDGTVQDAKGMMKATLTPMDAQMLGLKASVLTQTFPDYALRSAVKMAEGNTGVTLASLLHRFSGKGWISFEHSRKLFALFGKQDPALAFLVPQGRHIPSEHIDACVNAISTAVYLHTGDWKAVVQARLSMIHAWDAGQGFALTREMSDVWWEVSSPTVWAEMAESAKTIWGHSMHPVLTQDAQTLQALTTWARKLGFDLGFGNIRSVMLADRVIWDGTLRIYARRIGSSDVLSGWKYSPWFGGEEATKGMMSWRE